MNHLKQIQLKFHDSIIFIFTCFLLNLFFKSTAYNFLHIFISSFDDLRFSIDYKTPFSIFFSPMCFSLPNFLFMFSTFEVIRLT